MLWPLLVSVSAASSDEIRDSSLIFQTQNICNQIPALFDDLDKLRSLLRTLVYNDEVKDPSFPMFRMDRWLNAVDTDYLNYPNFLPTLPAPLGLPKKPRDVSSDVLPSTFAPVGVLDTTAGRDFFELDLQDFSENPFSGALETEDQPFDSSDQEVPLEERNTSSNSAVEHVPDEVERVDEEPGNSQSPEDSKDELLRAVSANAEEPLRQESAEEEEQPSPSVSESHLMLTVGEMLLGKSFPDTLSESAALVSALTNIVRDLEDRLAVKGFPNKKKLGKLKKRLDERLALLLPYKEAQQIWTDLTVEMDEIRKTIETVMLEVKINGASPSTSVSQNHVDVVKRAISRARALLPEITANVPLFNKYMFNFDHGIAFKCQVFEEYVHLEKFDPENMRSYLFVGMSELGIYVQNFVTFVRDFEQAAISTGQLQTAASFASAAAVAASVAQGGPEAGALEDVKALESGAEQLSILFTHFLSNLSEGSSEFTVLKLVHTHLEIRKLALENMRLIFGDTPHVKGSELRWKDLISQSSEEFHAFFGFTKHGEPNKISFRPTEMVPLRYKLILAFLHLRELPNPEKGLIEESFALANTMKTVTQDELAPEVVKLVSDAESAVLSASEARDRLNAAGEDMEKVKEEFETVRRRMRLVAMYGCSTDDRPRTQFLNKLNLARQNVNLADIMIGLRNKQKQAAQNDSKGTY